MIRIAFTLAACGVESDDIAVSFRGCSLRVRKTPGLRAGGVNGLHGHSARAPVDDAGRTGRMSVNAERPRERKGPAIAAECFGMRDRIRRRSVHWAIS